ncbi:protein FRG1-like isoform X1 [Haliotis rubra]|uniref:protein FRG1-like isoform X1 n=1 Tax=Haliotis rubra TaxID=36100 RepID=UPI001EE4F3AD|nr:protein FRG1-like isoform X1 [Haliotis rubra]
MADSYSKVKGGKLKLKGHKEKHKKHRKRKHADGAEGGAGGKKVHPSLTEDTARHGGWWIVEKVEEITGNIAMEIGVQTYMNALDNGRLNLGPVRDTGDAPDVTEILTAITVGESKIALKSGYGKYLSIDPEGRVVGKSDAIGSREQWEPVFQEGKMALNGFNGCFLSANEDGAIMCESRKAGPDEMIKIRSCAESEEDPLGNVPKEERGSLKDSEVNYVKKFQSFQDRRLRVTGESTTALKTARQDGTLHEAMLDRREKMKADRYCK